MVAGARVRAAPTPNAFNLKLARGWYQGVDVSAQVFWLEPPSSINVSQLPIAKETRRVQLIVWSSSDERSLASASFSRFFCAIAGAHVSGYVFTPQEELVDDVMSCHAMHWRNVLKAHRTLAGYFASLFSLEYVLGTEGCP